MAVGGGRHGKQRSPWWYVTRWGAAGVCLLVTVSAYGTASSDPQVDVDLAGGSPTPSSTSSPTDTGASVPDDLLDRERPTWSPTDGDESSNGEDPSDGPGDDAGDPTAPAPTTPDTTSDPTPTTDPTTTPGTDDGTTTTTDDRPGKGNDKPDNPNKPDKDDRDDEDD